MPDLFDEPLRELEDDLARIDALLSLIEELRSFATIATPATVASEPWDVASRKLRDTIRSLSADTPALSGTLLLYLAGRFEHFVRTAFHSTSDALAGKCATFELLPEKMRKSLSYHTAEVVMTPAKFGFGPSEAMGFVLTLASNFGAKGGLGAVNSACLSVTQNNMTPQMLSDLFGRVGFTGVWKEISKQARLKTHLELQADADVERQTKALLEEIMGLRNRIAHPSGAPAFPSPESVKAYLLFTLVVCRTLADVCRAHVAAFKPVAAGEAEAK